MALKNRFKDIGSRLKSGLKGRGFKKEKKEPRDEALNEVLGPKRRSVRQQAGSGEISYTEEL